MGNNKKKLRSSPGSRQGSRQDPPAGNRFEEQLNRFKSIYGIEPGHGSDTELAKKLGLTREAIGQWKEKGSIPPKWITEICKKEGIEMNWIITGKTQIHRERSRIREPDVEYRVFTQIPPGGGLLPDSFILIHHIEAPLGAGGRELIPAASPYELLAFRSDWISKVATSPKNLILLPVKGPSMEKTMFDGDLVMVDRGQKGIIRDLIYAVRIQETLTIKRIQILPDGRYRLISDNKDFPPEDFSEDEIKVSGRVIWLARDQIK